MGLRTEKEDGKDLGDDGWKMSRIHPLEQCAMKKVGKTNACLDTLPSLLRDLSRPLRHGQQLGVAAAAGRTA